MPPKAKYTKEQIIKAAFDLTREEGLGAVTARALGAKLGSSARPIFSVFDNMDEVIEEVIKAAKKLYTEYIDTALNQTDMPAFKAVGVQYIRFAMVEPKLFMIMFMSEQKEKPDVMNVLPIIDENYPKILASVKNSFQFDDEQSERLYRRLWIFSHGIAVLCATNMCSFTFDEIGKMLADVCLALIKRIKEESK